MADEGQDLLRSIEIAGTRAIMTGDGAGCRQTPMPRSYAHFRNAQPRPEPVKGFILAKTLYALR